MPINLTAVPVTPVRVFTTLSGAGACRLQPKGWVDVKVTGIGGVPSTGVGAVALNVTAVRPTAATYLSVYPTGTAFPSTSSVNALAGGVAAGMVIVPVGSNGRVSIRSSHSPVDVNVDVLGYFTTASTGSNYSVSAQQKIMDSRDTSAMAAKERRKILVAGQFGVPANATGVLVNVTAASTGTAGNVGVSTAYGTVIGTSTVYYAAGDSSTNRALVALAPDGTIEVYASSQSHARIDLVGWFGTGGQDLRYNPLLPGRVLDTRNGTGGVAPLAGGAPASLTVEGQRGIPVEAHAVVGTLTVIRPTVATKTTIWPTGSGQPATADFALPGGTVREGLVSPVLSQEGKVALTVASGSADATLDVLGYFR
jgi:hypothetical protein